MFVKDHKNTESPKVREKYGTLGGGVGIVCNLLLFIIKFSLGLISGAVSIMADAFNNLSDIGSSVVSILGFKLSKKPADPDHPFGHGRIEYMSAFIVAILICLVGFELLKTSVEKIINPVGITLSVFTVIGLVVSIIIKFWMFTFCRKLGRTINSASLIATSRDSLNDSIATSGVLLAMLIFKFFKVNLDAYMGAAVALFILWSGFLTARETLSPLLGEPPSKELIKGIENEILKRPEFLGIHDLIVHNYGPGRCFASVHVEVPEDINTLYCHELIDAAEVEIREKFGIEMVIHMDPICVNDENLTKTKGLVAAKLIEWDEKITIHDFRMVLGENRTNLVFDVVIPHSLAHLPQSEIKTMVALLVKEIDKKYVSVIQIDYDYT